MKPSKRPKSRLSLRNEPFCQEPIYIEGFIRLLPFLLNNSLDCWPLDFEGPSLGRRKGLMGGGSWVDYLFIFELISKWVPSGYNVPFRSVSNQ